VNDVARRLLCSLKAATPRPSNPPSPPHLTILTYSGVRNAEKRALLTAAASNAVEGSPALETARLGE